MALPAAESSIDNGASDGPDTERLRRFLQHGHVFSAAVREVLEAKYLDEVAPQPMTVPQFHLLKLISLKGRHQVGEVAEQLGVSSPAVSKNIDKLEGLGLVTRSSSKGDRRVTLLSASREGYRLVERYEDLKATRLEPVLDTFSSDELEQLTGLLKRFAINLYQAESAEVTFCLRCAAYGDTDCYVADIHGNCPYRKTSEEGQTVDITTEEAT